MGVADLIEQAVSNDSRTRRITVLNEEPTHNPSSRIRCLNNTALRTFPRIRVSTPSTVRVFGQTYTFGDEQSFSQMIFEHPPAQTLEEMIDESEEAVPLSVFHQDRREVIDAQTTNLSSLVRKHSKWLMTLSATGFLGLCLKSPFIYNHFSERQEYRTVAQVYEQVIKQVPQVNNVIYVNHKGECRQFIQGVSRLQDCSFEGELVHGTYALSRNGDGSLRTRFGQIQTSWPTDVSRSVAVVNSHKQNSSTNNTSYRTNSSASTVQRRQANTQQSTQRQHTQQRPATSRFDRVRPSSCSFNFLREYGVREGSGSYCMSFSDDSRICTVRINNNMNNTYYLPSSSSHVFRDRGSDGILGWSATYDYARISREGLLRNSWSQFSASRERGVQGAYAARIRGLEQGGREKKVNGCS